MPTSNAYFFGGPCDGRGVVLTYKDKPPASVVCKGTTYHYNPNAKGALAYATTAYINNYNASLNTREARDVFRAWHGLMRTLHHSQKKQHREMSAASKRIRRAVK